MAFSTRCECGWHVVVEDDLLGETLRCEECGNSFVVKRRKRSADREVAEIEEELDRLVDASQSAASNPAMLRVSYLKYVRAYPKWPVIWFLLVVISGTLAWLVSWWFGLLTAFSLWALHIHHKRTLNQFIGGCVNPSRVLSLDPPLVGVLTNLTKGGGEWNVVKVMPQPLQHMAMGMPGRGQRVATVAYYQSIYDDLDHWDDFHPRLPDVASSDREGLERVFLSIDKEDWQELDDGLSQLPKNPEPGLYRLYEESLWNAEREAAREDVAQIVQQTLEGLSKNYCFTPDDGLTDEHVEQCQAYAPGIKRKAVLALIESKGTLDAKEGMVLTASRFHYRFKNVGEGVHVWSDVVGAFASEPTFEIALRGGQRLRIPRNRFMSAVLAPLENCFNEIAEESLV